MPFEAPTGEPSLGFLVGGFVLMVVGLAALTQRRAPGKPLHSAEATRRAIAYAAVYGLCAGCFARLVAPALLGREHSPWLLALGDVMFVTLALYTWVMTLAEGHPTADLGFRAAAPGRLVFATLLGLVAAAVYAFEPLTALARGRVPVDQDALVFALLFAVAGSALPEEVLFRGYLMGSLNGRARRWARVAIPAVAFAAVRAVRFLPGRDLAADQWLFYVLGTALPLGLWWGLMRDLAGGSIWPSLISHTTLELTTTLVNATAS